MEELNTQAYFEGKQDKLSCAVIVAGYNVLATMHNSACIE